MSPDSKSNLWLAAAVSNALRDVRDKVGEAASTPVTLRAW